MARRGFFGRIFDAVERIFQGGAPEPEVEPEAGPTHEEPVETYPYREEYGEPPAYYPEEPPYEAYAPQEPDVYERVWGPGELPETSSATEEFEYLSGNYGIEDDAYTRELLWGGWFSGDLSPEERRQAREDFFYEMGWEPEDFDWDDWRDWYASTAG